MPIKHFGRKIATLAIIAAMMLGVGVVMGMRAHSASAHRVDYFDIENKNFIAETHGVKRMEVWVVPHGARNENDWDTLGLMKRESHWFSWALWQLPIPEEPNTPLLQIMVRAYDEKNVEIDRVSLPWIGPESLHEAVWSED